MIELTLLTLLNYVGNNFCQYRDLSLRVAKNKLGLIEATNAIRPKNLEGSLSIIGEKGSVIVGGMTGEKLVEWSIKKNSNIKKLLNINSKIKNGHIKFYQYVINTLNNKSKNILNISEGMKSLKIINSIYKSSSSENMLEINKKKKKIKAILLKEIFFL